MPVASPVKTKGVKRRTSDRYEAFIQGELSIEDLDMEELLKGQIRDRNGGFTGRPPLQIPRAFHTKVVQELLQRADQTWRSNLDAAMKVFVEIMENPRVRAQDRLYAAQYIIERTAGKIPDKQVIEASVRKWEDVADAVIVEVLGDEYEDAEIVPTSPVLGVRWEDDVEEPGSLLAIGSERAPSTVKAPRRPTRRNKEE